MALALLRIKTFATSKNSLEEESQPLTVAEITEQFRYSPARGGSDLAWIKPHSRLPFTQ